MPEKTAAPTIASMLLRTFDARLISPPVCADQPGYINVKEAGTAARIDAPSAKPTACLGAEFRIVWYACLTPKLLAANESRCVRKSPELLASNATTMIAREVTPI